MCLLLLEHQGCPTRTNGLSSGQQSSTPGNTSPHASFSPLNSYDPSSSPPLSKFLPSPVPHVPSSTGSTSSVGTLIFVLSGTRGHASHPSTLLVEKLVSLCVRGWKWASRDFSGWRAGHGRGALGPGQTRKSPKQLCAISALTRSTGGTGPKPG